MPERALSSEQPDPIEAAPSAPARSRAAAAVVALVVFVAASAFAWRALAPGGRAVDRRQPTDAPADVAPRVVVVLEPSEEYDHYPAGTLTFGDRTVDAAIGSFGWCEADGSCGIADVVTPEFDGYLTIPVGAELVIRTSASWVDASIGDARFPFEHARPIPTVGGVGTLDGSLGRHGLVFDVRWGDDDVYLEGPLYFAIDLVEGDPSQPTSSPEPAAWLYEADATVLESEEHGPVLCVGGIADSLPPQCGGIRLVGWDWDVVDGEGSVAGTTWGSFHVVGSYDGTTMTVTDAGPFRPPPPEEPADRFAAPCPEPEGGWVATDPTRATDEDRVAAARTAEAEPDSAGVWIVHLVEPSDEQPTAPGEVILVAAFTGDLDRHADELATIWGGPLCVMEHERTLRDLRRIHAELGTDVAAELGLQATWSDVDVVRNVVELGVVVADDAARAVVDARYGAGAVELVPALTAVLG